MPASLDDDSFVRLDLDAFFQIVAYIIYFFFDCLLTSTLQSDPCLISAFAPPYTLLALETTHICRCNLDPEK